MKAHESGMTRSELQKKHQSLYKWLRKNNRALLEEYFPNVKRPKGYWTLETCLEDAKKYASIFEWRKDTSSGYQTACAKGWIEQCRALFAPKQRPAGFWTLEKCKAEALKYSSRKEWRSKDMASYTQAYKKSWIEECCSHMNLLKRPKGYWTLEKCKAEALKYKSRYEWQKNGSPSYQAAKAYGWMEECSAHMSPSATPSEASKRRWAKHRNSVQHS